MLTEEQAKKELKELKKFTKGKMPIELEVSPEDFDVFVATKKKMRNVKNIEITLRVCNNFINQEKEKKMQNIVLAVLFVFLFSAVSCADNSVAESPSEESAVEAVVSTDDVAPTEPEVDSENYEDNIDEPLFR